MKRTNAQIIGDVLNRFFEENSEMADKLAEVRLMDCWHNMSPMISRYTINLFIKNRVLYVKLSSSILKNELMMGKEDLIEKLNTEAGREVIDDIVLMS